MISISGRIVSGDQLIDGALTVENGLIATLAPGRADDCIVLPGFVDLHVHGGGGGSYTDPDQAAETARFHLQHGTTTTLASLVTAPIDALRRQIRDLEPLVEDGTLAGIHLEGPFLAAARCGAQDPRYLTPPTPANLAPLLESPAVRMITLAPELPGAQAAIHIVTSQGVIAAVGHTDADYDQAMRAIDAGVTVATHLFNTMPQPHHRAPGPAIALLNSAEVTCELVADGIHLDDAMIRLAHRAAPDRIALVTDAISAAGMADGRYDLGGQTVSVADGVARLDRTGAIAGSTATTADAFRTAVRAGLSLVEAGKAAATTPARTLGLKDRGVLTPGARADLVVLNPDLSVRKVMRAGVWV